MRQRAVGPVVVVVADELIEQCLEVGDRGRLDWLGAEPPLQRLLESFDLAAGGRVVRAGVLLPDVQLPELVLEVVASAAAAGESGGGGTSLHEVLGGKTMPLSVSTDAGSP